MSNTNPISQPHNSPLTQGMIYGSRVPMNLKEEQSWKQLRSETAAAAEACNKTEEPAPPATPASNAFGRLIQEVLEAEWKLNKTGQRNPRHRLDESDKRRILRMQEAGYNAWEASEILNQDYSTIKRLFDSVSKPTKKAKR